MDKKGGNMEKNAGKKKISNKLLLFSLVVLLISGFLTYWMMSDKSTLRISQQYAQDQISQHLPISKDFKIKMIAAHLDVESFNISFIGDDRLGVNARCIVTTRFGRAEVTVDSVGVPDYHDQYFFYKPLPSSLHLSEFKFSGKAADNISKAGHFAKNVIDKMAEGKIADSMAISNEEFQAELKAYAQAQIEKAVIKHLENHPLKKVDGIKGLIISLAIDKIGVDQGELLIHFSLLKMTLRIVAAIVISIAAFAAILTAPWWASGLLLAASLID